MATNQNRTTYNTRSTRLSEMGKAAAAVLDLYTWETPDGRVMFTTEPNPACISNPYLFDHEVKSAWAGLRAALIIAGVIDGEETPGALPGGDAQFLLVQTQDYDAGPVNGMTWQTRAMYEVATGVNSYGYADGAALDWFYNRSKEVAVRVLRHTLPALDRVAYLAGDVSGVHDATVIGLINPFDIPNVASGWGCIGDQSANPEPDFFGLDSPRLIVIPTGTRGPAGADGLDGFDGEDGAPGLQGEQGPQGEPGPQGEQGPQGDTGPRGPQGEPGTGGGGGGDGLPVVLVDDEAQSVSVIGEESALVRVALESGQSYRIFIENTGGSEMAFYVSVGAPGADDIAWSQEFGSGLVDFQCLEAGEYVVSISDENGAGGSCDVSVSTADFDQFAQTGFMSVETLSGVIAVTGDKFLRIRFTPGLYTLRAWIDSAAPVSANVQFSIADHYQLLPFDQSGLLVETDLNEVSTDKTMGFEITLEGVYLVRVFDADGMGFDFSLRCDRVPA